MKVFFHDDFYAEYTTDPAAESGRMESIIKEIGPFVDIVSCEPTPEKALRAAHTQEHIEDIRKQGLYEISALAAGGAIQAADAGLKAPAFGLISPPGHHASSDSCWGFCFFNNMAVSLLHLKRNNLIDKAFVLDFDFHFGDGTVDILGDEPWVEILNPQSHKRQSYLDEVEKALSKTNADVIAVSAGFDNHFKDWIGGLLETEDYTLMATWVRETAARNGGGCYGILEGGYNQAVLGRNVHAFLQGLDSDTIGT